MTVTPEEETQDACLARLLQAGDELGRRIFQSEHDQQQDDAELATEGEELVACAEPGTGSDRDDGAAGGDQELLGKQPGGLFADTRELPEHQRRPEHIGKSGGLFW